VVDSNRSLRSDARRNRQRVLEAAEAAFASEGVSVPVDEIARRAKVGAGTVYRHFPTKESIFLAVVVAHIERMVVRARALAKSKDPGTAFFTFLDSWIEEGMARRDVIDALTAQGFDVNSAVQVVGEDLYTQVETLMVRAQRAGAVRKDVGILELRALLIAISLAIRNGTDPQVVRKLVRILGDGLSASRKPSQARVTRGQDR